MPAKPGMYTGQYVKMESEPNARHRMKTTGMITAKANVLPQRADDAGENTTREWHTGHLYDR